jgi:hypothetical protein
MKTASSDLRLARTQILALMKLPSVAADPTAIHACRAALVNMTQATMIARNVGTRARNSFDFELRCEIRVKHATGLFSAQDLAEYYRSNIGRISEIVNYKKQAEGDAERERQLILI